MVSDTGSETDPPCARVTLRRCLFEPWQTADGTISGLYDEDDEDEDDDD